MSLFGRMRASRSGEGPCVASPTYHDLHITTADIARASISGLPHGLEVRCSRATGWQLRRVPGEALAGEYEGPGAWLVLDVAGHVIVDSRRDC